MSGEASQVSEVDPRLSEEEKDFNVMSGEASPVSEVAIHDPQIEELSEVQKEFNEWLKSSSVLEGPPRSNSQGNLGEGSEIQGTMTEEDKNYYIMQVIETLDILAKKHSATKGIYSLDHEKLFALYPRAAQKYKGFFK